ncbi:hypothetical protein [Halomarina pelagica]|uniref:hypothetical protein n=1 Tax=Halomarina pelagica TaxID=2961599 RepID=UPI0020C516BD|nr:hypothetical protein [Halomarina sp. BND7]
MTPKDISAIGNLERAVRDEPTILHSARDQIERQLTGDDPSQQLDAGRALRAAAEHDPQLVEPYLGPLVGLLDTEHGSLQLSGAIGVAELATLDPEHPEIVDAVPRLIEVLDETVAPTVEEATLRALT